VAGLKEELCVAMNCRHVEGLVAESHPARHGAACGS
jgi:hypothetical protein